ALRSVMEPKVNHKALEDVRSAMTRLMPSLKGLKVVKTWAGFWDLTPDMIPVLGEVKQPKGLFVAAGFSGHGFALGPITGRILSELIVDGRSSLPIDAFNPSRFVKGQKVPPIKRVI
ncbi:MAG: FAD-binding oxidoreductase, partial [Dehalococcoidia bacterium]